VQTQINAKQAVVSGVNDTEIGYLDGVTSAIQTQINAQIPKSTVTAKGDILVATGSGTLVAQGVGANGTVLTANSAQADGVEWVAPGGALTLSQIATGSLNTGTSLTVSSLTQDFIQIQLTGITFGTNGSDMLVRLNGDSTALYNFAGFSTQLTGSFYSQGGVDGAINLTYGLTQRYNNANNRYIITLQNCKATGFTSYTFDSYFFGGPGSNDGCYSRASGIYRSAAQITSLQFLNASGLTFNGSGTYTVWGG
jgi:hypothetical protein